MAANFGKATDLEASRFQVLLTVSHKVFIETRRPALRLAESSMSQCHHDAQFASFTVLGLPETHWLKTQGNRSVETFRIDYLIKTPKVEKLSLQPIRRLGSAGREIDVSTWMLHPTRCDSKLRAKIF